MSAILFGGCSPAVTYRMEPEYRQSGFSMKRLADCSMTVFPLLSSLGPDTTRFFSAFRHEKLLSRMRPDIQVTRSDRFQNEVRAVYGKATADSFLHALGDGHVAVLQTTDSVWNLVKTDFAVVTRIANGLTIHAFSGKTKRKVTLELEIWDPTLPEVVWRATAKAENLDRSMSDRDFVFSALRKAYDHFPVYQPGMNETNW